MKKILLLSGLLASLTGLGQTHLLGVQLSGNATGVRSSNFLLQDDLRSSFSSGITYTYLLKEPFWIGADLLYSPRGMVNNLVFTDVNGVPTGEQHPLLFNYDYLAMPLKGGIQAGKKLFGFANVALVPALLINAKTFSPVFDARNQFQGYQVYQVTKNVSRFDLAGMAELGVGYKIKGTYWLYAMAGYQQSFTSITNDNYFRHSKIKHYGLAFSVGFKCPLLKKDKTLKTPEALPE